MRENEEQRKILTLVASVSGDLMMPPTERELEQKDDMFSLGHVEFGVSKRHPNGDVR